MKQLIYTLVVFSVFLFSCKKDNSDKPTKGTVQISCNVDFKLTTGEIKNKPAEAMYIIWKAENKNFDRFPSDFGDGYAYDSTSKKSYESVYRGEGTTVQTTLSPGRYFLFLILPKTPDDYDLPDFANSSIYFTITAGEKTTLTKTFGADTYSTEMTEWDE